MNPPVDLPTFHGLMRKATSQNFVGNSSIFNPSHGLGGKFYFILGSATSTMPGIVLSGIHVPLRPGIYTNILIGARNSREFTNFFGGLNALGSGTASLNVPANLPIPLGFKLHHACVVFDLFTGQIFTASNPVPVEFK